MLNHVTDLTTIGYYIDPRILSAFCCKHKIPNSNISPSIYHDNTEWKLALESMENYKDFEF